MEDAGWCEVAYRVARSACLLPNSARCSSPRELVMASSRIRARFLANSSRSFGGSGRSFPWAGHESLRKAQVSCLTTSSQISRERAHMAAQSRTYREVTATQISRGPVARLFSRIRTHLPVSATFVPTATGRSRVAALLPICVRWGLFGLNRGYSVN